MRTITKSQWQKTHRDYKLVSNGQRYILANTMAGSALVPVIVKGMK